MRQDISINAPSGKNILACIKRSLSTGMGFAESSSWGRYVLYEVNDDDRTCRVLAVVGQGQKPRDMFE